MKETPPVRPPHDGGRAEHGGLGRRDFITNGQDYNGKRVYIQLTDKKKVLNKFKTRYWVHKYFDMKQDNYYFDFNIIDKSVSLLINSKEQIIVEKLKSLLKFGITSTRFKDIFDFYYLINNEKSR